MSLVMEPPYDRTEAEFLRLNAAAEIWACFWCAVESWDRRYWPAKMLAQIGHRFACPKHKGL